MNDASGGGTVTALSSRQTDGAKVLSQHYREKAQNVVATLKRLFAWSKTPGAIALLTLCAFWPFLRGWLLRSLEFLLGRIIQRASLTFRVLNMPKRIILLRHGQSEGNVSAEIYSTVPDHMISLTAHGIEQARRAGRVIKKIVGDGDVKIYCSPYLRAKQTISAVLAAFEEASGENVDAEGFLFLFSRHLQRQRQGEGVVGGSSSQLHREEASGSSGSWTGIGSSVLSHKGGRSAGERGGSSSSSRASFSFIRRLRNVTVVEEPRLREQEFGFGKPLRQLREESQLRQLCGHFYYRFPGGESGADVYDRVTAFVEKLYRHFQHEKCARNLVVVSHGLTIRLLLMRMLRWTVDEFHQMDHLRNAEMVILERTDEGTFKPIHALRKKGPSSSSSGGGGGSSGQGVGGGALGGTPPSGSASRGPSAGSSGRRLSLVSRLGALREDGDGEGAGGLQEQMDRLQPTREASAGSNPGMGTSPETPFVSSGPFPGGVDHEAGEGGGPHPVSGVVSEGHRESPPVYSGGGEGDAEGLSRWIRTVSSPTMVPSYAGAGGEADAPQDSGAASAPPAADGRS
uniref:Uncharacterized protein n=1 Tax=Chromera velia CCMP2878 TaxID=1169474 RepID=A0A0G4F2V9_9ALVE|eukprot:Cvel_14970.t1-p1 / transcript=Cvel_14970.t1 / gene=Cvel_14970 / organism=Chromera_velia_CCMP2878 / gene_product=Broad-range acid phosphatase DET1, putative / transcript_product=Broad-range acid phosphatase DET1, putative / location=Cvel_scaffold1087:45074-50184(-) / protein_length=570 / sequence_SO=supercontig / SO=protein_coding / is_pseudo=false